VTPYQISKEKEAHFRNLAEQNSNLIFKKNCLIYFTYKKKLRRKRDENNKKKLNVKLKKL
jgi:hypothetical protein